MSDLKLVIFDMDGTLMDSQEFILLAMRYAFDKAGHPAPSKADVLSIVGLSLDAAVAVLLPDLDEAENLRTVELYRHSFIELREKMGAEAKAPLYPGARAALERLYAVDNIVLGVATGKAKRGLDHAYDSHGIGHFFETSQTADNHPSKPHPSMLLQTLKDTGVEASNAVMVGDTEFDMEMGRAAGFKTIGVSWGYHPISRLGAADIIIDDFSELDAALAEMWS
ncbi:MAG: HAD-IA family hydrolase [Rhodobacteraceae bacterium]|nr:HAD-IA family hydrolase [Paracoccaceae bacterium]